MKLKYLLLPFILLVTLTTFAATSPVTVLQNTSNQMLDALNKTKERTPANLNKIVNQILLPHVNLETMSRLVLNQPGTDPKNKYWDNATPAQQQQFKQLFVRYVVNMYSTALASYKNEKVMFLPQVNNIGTNQVKVDSRIYQEDGSFIPVSYQMQLVSGNWKVYDFSVNGISMIQNYRSQFRDVLMQQGLNGLLQTLRTKMG